jgi:uncharacterized protein (TIGR00251 family)
MIAVAPHPGGVVLEVLAQPGSKRAGIMGQRDGALKVAVTAPPDKGTANVAIQSVLADALACKTSRITLLSGGKSRRKRFLIAGIDTEELTRRLAALIVEPESSRSQS